MSAPTSDWTVSHDRAGLPLSLDYQRWAVLHIVPSERTNERLEQAAAALNEAGATVTIREREPLLCREAHPEVEA